MSINWERLKECDPVLHDAVRPYWDGVDAENRDRFKYGVNPALAKKVGDWRKEQDEIAAAVREEAQEKESQREEDQKEGVARLVEYTKLDGGLEDTRANSDFIRKWLDKNVRGYISAANIDVCIQCLGPKGTNVLTWRKPAPTPPAPEPTETPDTCKDSKAQLPLGTQPQRHQSIEQLRDLDRRERAARGRGGWHGVKF